MRKSSEAAFHFFRALEVAIGVALAAVSERVDRALLADGGHYILEQAVLGRVIQHVAGRDAAHADGACLGVELVEAHRIARAPAERYRHVAPPAKHLAQLRQIMAKPFARHVGQQYGDKPVGMRGDLAPIEVASALPCPGLANRQQAGEARPRRLVCGVEEQRSAIL
jgi:hypothetical protein